jgi:hypothetical protein
MGACTWLYSTCFRRSPSARHGAIVVSASAACTRARGLVRYWHVSICCMSPPLARSRTRALGLPTTGVGAACRTRAYLDVASLRACARGPVTAGLHLSPLFEFTMPTCACRGLVVHRECMHTCARLTIGVADRGDTVPKSRSTHPSGRYLNSGIFDPFTRAGSS